MKREFRHEVVRLSFGRGTAKFGAVNVVGSWIGERCEVLVEGYMERAPESGGGLVRLRFASSTREKRRGAALLATKTSATGKKLLRCEGCCRWKQHLYLPSLGLGFLCAACHGLRESPVVSQLRERMATAPEGVAEVRLLASHPDVRVQRAAADALAEGPTKRCVPHSVAWGTPVPAPPKPAALPAFFLGPACFGTALDRPKAPVLVRMPSRILDLSGLE